MKKFLSRINDYNNGIYLYKLLVYLFSIQCRNQNEASAVPVPTVTSLVLWWLGFALLKIWHPVFKTYMANAYYDNYSIFYQPINGSAYIIIV